ncbi:glycosyltransferase family 4 protein [Sphingomonas sp.]|uniref:glycosyltransferase family 4 protein n=1 Tax=Sphingomonas sp. TaxID=28214 RepID=UPI0035C8716E
MSEAVPREPTRVLMIGGSAHHPGGLESYCARAMEAVARSGRTIALTWLESGTAYLSPRHLPGIARVIAAMRRKRRDGFAVAWVQASNLTELALAEVAQRLGYQVIVTPHFGAASRMETHGLARAVAARLLARADRVALLFASQAEEICVPRTAEHAVVGTFLPDASLAGPPIDRAPPDHVRLLHAGRFSEGKGTFRMVAFCAALRARGVPFSARIIGRGDAATSARLHAAVAAADLGAVIAIEDWRDEAGLIAALREADVLVHLSTLDSFPLIVLEAMACDTYPIVFDMAGAGDMVARFGGLSLPRDAEIEPVAARLGAIPTAVLRARARVIGAGVRAAYDWPVIVGGLERIVVDVASR